MLYAALGLYLTVIFLDKLTNLEFTMEGNNFRLFKLTIADHLYLM